MAAGVFSARAAASLALSAGKNLQRLQTPREDSQYVRTGRLLDFSGNFAGMSVALVRVAKAATIRHTSLYLL